MKKRYYYRLISKVDTNTNMLFLMIICIDYQYYILNFHY